MRILIIDNNNIDFVNNEDDYRRVLEVIMQPHAVGVTRVTL
jgi:hypothetical protein